MSVAVYEALERAKRGVTWAYPCLIWAADYVRDATGRDPAAGWRDRDWDKVAALSELAKLASTGSGIAPVERAMDAIAKRHGWPEADGNRQGAVMVGVYRDLAENGAAAVFDGQSRWIVALMEGGFVSMQTAPDRCWEVPL